MPETYAGPDWETFMAANRTPLHDLEKYETAYLEVFLSVIRRNSEVETPSENLLFELLKEYGENGHLPVDALDNLIAGFRRNLDHFVQEAAETTRLYPDLVRAALAAA